MALCEDALASRGWNEDCLAAVGACRPVGPWDGRGVGPWGLREEDPISRGILELWKVKRAERMLCRGNHMGRARKGQEGAQ